ncbi:alpha/beta fold hydrolase [Acidovorax sp. ACV01]|uniref:alpha/beta fold hydrolase n=1 Tax=Acidovorax sp. ACV01 TaxID=2769311 RepID=UPI001783E6FA|nr:alpha/beta hydrolase [Acidovorax sp. ACV01]MBD9394117.1 alpha/beta hydrolase [Acidovorax sp. ACV01]
MIEKAEFKRTRWSLVVDGVGLEIAAIHREGDGTPVVFLHGFGSTKEDYADLVRHADFAGRPFVAYDAPGCGESQCGDLGRISIDFLAATALEVLGRLDIERFDLVGHSMGGLTSLMLAHRHPEKVLSFVNIEGNVAPEDCFLSRQIFGYPQADAQIFFDEFIERARHAPAYASALYAASLKHKVRPGAVRPIFESMVNLSDHGMLMDKFLGLPCPRMFMYGEQNAHLSYLSYIREKGVRLAPIPHCGHFPMYSNPIAMWDAIAAFHRSRGVRNEHLGL